MSNYMYGVMIRLLIVWYLIIIKLISSKISFLLILAYNLNCKNGLIEKNKKKNTLH